MSADLRIVMANSWTRWVQDVGGDIIIVTAAHVGEAMQFLAAIRRSDGSMATIPYLRAKNAAPLRVDIPVRPGRSFTFDETIHDLTNLAEIGVFRAMHQAALEQFLSATELASRPTTPFRVLDGGKTSP